MSQFDVFENPEHARQPNVPYLLVIQSDHFTSARTCVVIPLVRAATVKVTTAVNQASKSAANSSLEPFQIAFIPAHLLRKKVHSLAGERTATVRAVDALMSGL